MNTYKWTFALALALSTMSASAQVSNTGNKPQSPLNRAVERAVVQATTVDTEEEFEPGLLIQAETLLQLDRNQHGGYAAHTLEYYYNQLKQEYAEAETAESAKVPEASLQMEEDALSIREQIDAETELAFIRNTWDPHASFEKYPYLLDAEYRRTADEQIRQRVRDEYKNGKRKNPYQVAAPSAPSAPTLTATTQQSFRTPDSAWGRKVGL